MTEDIVVDSNVFIVSLIDPDQLNAEEVRQRPLVIEYIEGIGDGRYIAHLPTIAFVEIVGVVRAKVGIGADAVIKNRLAEWVDLGLVKPYDLEEQRTTSAINLVLQHNVSRRKSLSAPDATFIGLAEELDVKLVTLEKYFASVYQRAVVPA